MKLFPVWFSVVAILLAIFNLYDQYIFNREDVRTPGALVEKVQPKRRLQVELQSAALDIREPWQYFWLTGFLSSFLDNAPTYLTFAAMASGAVGGSVENLGTLLETGLGACLLAISCGSVLMGANTYIGNGPNFMVKSIAESSSVKMPSFGGYMIYSGAILIPTFVVITLLFFI